MNVLVTGGAGYVGSHTAKALCAAGITPIVYDNLCRGHQWAVKWGPFVEADLKDVRVLRRTIDQYAIEAVVHFAAYAYVGESIDNPGLYFRNNIVNTLNLLETIRDAGVRHIILSSTCATYGDPQDGSLSESHIQSPVNPYGESKRTVERMLHWFGQAHGIQSVVLRYFNAAGADPDGQIGECHLPEPHLIPRAIAAAMGVGGPVEIYGNDYLTTDGTTVRDYVHVTDLAQAHLSALIYLQNHAGNSVFNLGTGQGHSVLDVIRTVEMVSGRTVPHTIVPRRKGDSPFLVADVSNAKSTLSWAPRHASLETIIRTAWCWHDFRVRDGRV